MGGLGSTRLLSSTLLPFTCLGSTYENRIVGKRTPPPARIVKGPLRNLGTSCQGKFGGGGGKGGQGAFNPYGMGGSVNRDASEV